jgi:predicted nuclease of predicted toxin-antitoxin system
MRFHLDEHIDFAIALGLRQRGIDVTTTADANLLGATDESHLEFIRKEGRVIFTSDRDFLRAASGSTDHPGITYCARNTRSIGHIVRMLTLMNDCMEPEEMLGKVEYI